MSTRRNYITEDEIEEFSNIQVTDHTEAVSQMSFAEEMIDSYVGFQQKHIRGAYTGYVETSGNNYIIDSSNGSMIKGYDDDFFTFCEVEIIGGTGKGQRRNVIAYEKDLQKITVDSNWTTNPDSTSFYIVHQIGKFPRVDDVYRADDNTYFKMIPDAVKRATMAQLEYIIEKGSAFFSGAGDYKSESLEGYSYTVNDRKNRFISPHARQLLRGIRNTKGHLIV